MPLPEIVKVLVEKKVGEFCKKRVPPHVLDKVNLSYKIKGNTVSIFENRAPWRPDMKEWTSMEIAKMKYDKNTGKWMLYYADRHNRWHKYWDFKPTKNLDAILVEIDRDPTGIFWG
ncbi:MAG: DUF3024 domain-containing protein [Nitrospirae bacterium]|nr:DUF3024 domain-containing protein [Nitrospirota bacterium]MDA8338996.1 DUF3024 domain-containing protein [Nitrospiraceae bacterium]